MGKCCVRLPKGVKYVRYEHFNSRHIKSVECWEPEGLVLVNSKDCPEQQNRPCSNKLCCLGKESGCTRNNCPNKLVG